MTEQTKSKLSKQRKAWWAALSPRQQRIQLNKMTRGKAAKKLTNSSKLAQSEIADEKEVEAHAAFLAGGFAKEIYHYARSNQISEPTLTQRVVAILRHSQLG